VDLPTRNMEQLKKVGETGIKTKDFRILFHIAKRKMLIMHERREAGRLSMQKSKDRKKNKQREG